MPEWVGLVVQGGFAAMLAMVLFYGGRWVARWLEAAQKFQHDMLIRSEEQQKSMSESWLAMLGEVEATNKELAVELKALFKQSQDVADSQAEAMKRMCDKLVAHDSQCGQRNELMVALLQQLIKPPR